MAKTYSALELKNISNNNQLMIDQHIKVSKKIKNNIFAKEEDIFSERQALDDIREKGYEEGEKKY